MRKISFILVLVGFSLFLLLTEHAMAEENVIKLGINTAITGRSAGYGIPQQTVANMFAKKWSQQGGINVGGKKYEVKLVIDDNKYNGVIARQVAEKQILRDAVKAMFSVGSTVMVGAGPVCQNYQTLFFGVGSGTGKIIGPDKPYVFSFWVGRELNNLAVWRYFKNNLKVNNVVSIFPNDDAGWEGTRTNREMVAPALGIKWLAEIPVEREDVDFTAAITKAIALQPDAIDFSGSPGQTALFCKQCGDLGFKGIKICGAPADAERVSRVAGKQGNGLYSTALFDSGPLVNPPMAEFLKEYKAEANNIDVLIESYHMMFDSWQKAVEKAGTLEPEKVMNALTSIKLTNIMGPAKLIGKEFWGIDRQVVYPTPISEVRDGHNYSVHAIPWEEIYEDVKQFHLKKTGK